MPPDTAPGRVAVAHWFAAVAAIVTAASMALLGDYLAALGFATAAVGSMSALVACERWHTWQHIAEHGRPPA
jgi:hypothetical protein